MGYTQKKITQKDFELYSSLNNPLALVDEMSKKQLNSVRWYIDCGDDDFLYKGNSLMHLKMREKGINHEFRIRDGGHNWTYWRSALPNVLGFISQRFHQ